MSRFFYKNKLIKEYFTIIVGITLMAFGVIVFFDSSDMVTGGFTGISIILRSVSERLFGLELPLWLSNLALNIPFFLIGFKMFGTKKFAKTIFSTIYLSFAFYIMGYVARYIELGDDLLLNAVFGGAICGFSNSLIFRNMASTGGTDMCAMIANRLYKSLSMTWFLLIFDVTIVAAGMFIFGPEKSLYSIISIYISTKICDSMLEGMKFAKAVFIISEESEKIADSLMRVLDRGASGIYARGMYTKADKDILLSVVSKKEIIQVKELVSEIDPSAFIIVTDVREVLGKGFLSIDS